MGSNRPGGASWWTRAVHVCTRTSSWLDSLTITSSTGIPASGCSQVLASDTYRGNRDLQVWPNANMVTNRGFVVLVSWLSGGSRVVIHADWVHMLPAAVVPSSGTPSVTEAGSEATFTVALQAPPTAAVTVAVSSRDTGEGTVSPSSMTFATTTWNTAQTVTVTGAQDNVDDGDVTWQVRLDPSSGDSNYNGLTNVDVDVTTTDDDGPPGVTLALAPASVAESGSGNAATVTATLSRPSAAATTVTVTAVSGLYTVGADNTIAIVAGSTTNVSDTVIVTAVDNDTDAPDRGGTVTATAANARAATDGTTISVTGAALTVRDDDPAPAVTLSANPSSVSENGGIATVTAVLSRPSSEPSTVTATAVAGSWTVGSDATITIAAGATTAASDTVLVTAVDDDVHQGSAGRSVTVTAALTNGQGAGAVTGAALTLTDDETLPSVALALSSNSIAENGGIATVTAALSGPSAAATTVTVTAVSGLYTVGADAAIVIAAGATTAASDTVLVTAADNDTDAPDRGGTVTATAANDRAAADGTTMSVTGAALTVRDDDAAPDVVLSLNPSSVSENGGIATVTATLSRPSSEPSTVTVTAGSGAAGLYTVGSDATIVIAAGSTTAASDTASIAAVDDAVHQGSAGRSATVTATLANGQGAGAVTGAALTLTDSETLPTVELALGPASISEEGGISTVTATLSGKSSAAVTLTVAAVAGTRAAAADFALSTATTR